LAAFVALLGGLALVAMPHGSTARRRTWQR
jgi:hypothetical protein